MTTPTSMILQTTGAAFDPTAAVFDKIQISLYDLYVAAMSASGRRDLSDRVFRDCILEGPGIVLVLPGTRFSHCTFGVEDIRHLLFRPVDQTLAIGAMPLRGCVFEGCTFQNLGFTGHPNFIDTMIRELGGPAPVGGNA